MVAVIDRMCYNRKTSTNKYKDRMQLLNSLNFIPIQMCLLFDKIYMQPNIAM